MGDIMIDLDYFTDESACLSSTLSDIEIINEGHIITSIIAWLRAAYKKLKEFLSKMWNKLVSLIRSKKKVNDPATTRACQDTLNDPSSYVLTQRLHRPVIEGQMPMVKLHKLVALKLIIILSEELSLV